MRKIVMYYHGGSANHGCEAIVRSTKKYYLHQRVYIHQLLVKMKNMGFLA